MKGKWKQYHSWSRSRQWMFDSCPRWYFYRYVGSYDVPYGHELHSLTGLLKGMYNIDFFLGSIVHKAIELQLDQIRRGREVPGPKTALSFISRQIDDIRNQQKKYVIEALNGRSIADDILVEKGKEAERQIKIFFNEFFDFYKDLDLIEHERISNFVIDGYTFYVVPDLITKNPDGRIYITDWKTDSKHKESIDPFQMNLYILWALDKGYGELTNLRAEVIFLDVGKSIEYKVTSDDLESFKKEIIENSKKLYEEIDKRDNERDFTKCNNEKTCISCGYFQYCKNQS